MKSKKLKRLVRKYFKSTEEVVSMFLGLVIVVVVVGLIFNFFQRKKGVVDIPGSSNIELSQNEMGESIVSGRYVVSKGDSLWEIAEEKYNDGYQWVKIAEANNLNNPSEIEIGDELVIPEVEVKVTAVVNNTQKDILVGSDYEVVKGDSLWKIAVRAYGDGYQWVKIAEANQSKLPNPNGLEIGMLLSVPKVE